MSRSIRAILITGLCTLVAACGGGGGGSGTSAPPPGQTQEGHYTVTWNINGLVSGSEVVLKTNGGFAQSVKANGPYLQTSPTLVANQSYELTIGIQPTGQVCIVSNPRGTIAHANIETDVVCAMTPERVLHALSRTDGFSTSSELVVALDGNFYGTTEEGGANGWGTLFRVTPTGDFTVLHSFGDPSQGMGDGAIPKGLVLGANGHLYGTTQGGGIGLNGGTVFEATLDGRVTILHSFGKGGSDGALPQAKLVLANDGNFYGTTMTGGANGTGTVFRITPAGDESVLYSFAPIDTGDGMTPMTPLIQGSDGALYGTTAHGGALGLRFDYGTVYRVTLGGSESILYSFGSTEGDGRGPATSLLQTTDGSLYGTTPAGGTSSVGTIFRISASGQFSTLYSFDGPANLHGSVPLGVLVQGPGGLLYGTTAGGGLVAGGTAFRFDPADGVTTCYSFGSTNDGVQSDGYSPSTGLTRGPDGAFYGASSQGGTFEGGVIYRIQGCLSQ